MPDGITKLLITSFISIMSTLVCIYYIGCSKEERFMVISKSKSVIQKYINRK
jgi:hypothetical protein